MDGSSVAFIAFAGPSVILAEQTSIANAGALNDENFARVLVGFSLHEDYARTLPRGSPRDGAVQSITTWFAVATN